MATKRLLRMLILVQIPILLGGLVAKILSASSLPEPFRNHVEESGPTAPMVWVIGGLLIIVGLTAYIGLYLFWGPARGLFLISIISTLLMAPVFGPTVQTGWEDIFTDALSIITGVILALVYYSSLKELYERPSKSS